MSERLGYAFRVDSWAYLLSRYRRSAVLCSQLAAVSPSGHLRRAACVRLIVVSAWMPLASSPIQILMPASKNVCTPALISLSCCECVLSLPWGERSAVGVNTVTRGVDHQCHDMRPPTWTVCQVCKAKPLAASRPSPQRMVRRPRILPVPHTVVGPPPPSLAVSPTLFAFHL